MFRFGWALPLKRKQNANVRMTRLKKDAGKTTRGNRISKRNLLHCWGFKAAKIAKLRRGPHSSKPGHKPRRRSMLLAWNRPRACSKRQWQRRRKVSLTAE